MDNAQAKELEESYHQVVAMYDMADELISTVMQSPQEIQEAHFSLVNPLVLQLEESADVLTEEFISIAEGKDAPSSHRSRIESAFRMVYTAMDEYQKRAAETAAAVSQSVSPVFEGIKRHVEKVITMFIGYVELTLDRIMQKNDLEQLKKREAKIAEMLHNISQTHGKSS